MSQSAANTSIDSPDEQQDVNILAMSDEEIKNFDVASLAETTVSNSESEEQETTETVTDDTESDDTEVHNIDPEPEHVDDSAIDPIKDGDDEDTAPKATNDYEEFYKKVTANFKANGVDMAITDPSEIVKFMQMGLNYTKKMQELAEPRRIYKMLQDAKIADSSTLSYLIDLYQQNPDAIAKLVKESGFDSYSVEDDKVANYQPTDKSPAPAVIVLNDVLEELKSSQFYSKVIDIAGSQWDLESRTFISQNPEYLRQLENHVSTGAYDQIQTIMNVERAKGNYKELSDFDLFNGIGDSLYQSGKLIGHPLQPNNATPIVKKTDTEVANKRKQAAATRTTTVNSQTKQPINYLAMSDEEIAKLGK